MIDPTARTKMQNDIAKAVGAMLALGALLFVMKSMEAPRPFIVFFGALLALQITGIAMMVATYWQETEGDGS